MMANKYISTTEHKSLLVVSFISLIFVLSTISFEIIEDYNYAVLERQRELEYQANGEQIPRFSNDSIDNTFPGLHLLTLFIFLSLLTTKRFAIPSILTTFYAIVFVYNLYEKYKFGFLGGEDFASKTDTFYRIYRMANGYEYFAAFFISVLLFWQISILLRMLIKTLQRKPELP